MKAHPGFRDWLAQLVDGAFALGALALLLFAIGVVCIVAGIYGLAVRGDGVRITDTTVMASLDDIGRSLCDEVRRVVTPAMDRTQALARDPQIIAAILGGDRARQTDACNGAIAASKALDAVALFDARGKILAINTIYLSGEPIPRERIDRVLGLNFDGREIIQRCTRNLIDDHVLEFQTTCDITPAYFDSTGLSVAYSVSVRDPATNKKIGVVSARLRFERLTDLIKTTTLGGTSNSIQFVTDQGQYFSEAINAGRVAPPIDPNALADIVAPLVAWKTDYCFTRSGRNYLSLFRLNDFVTDKGDGIQVMAMADEAWFVAEANQVRTRRSGGMITGGLLLLLLAVLMQVYGIAPLRRSTRSRATLAAVVECSEDAIFGETLDGRILSWNQAAARMFGYRADEVLGKNISILPLPSQAGAFAETQATAVQKSQPRCFDTEYVRMDGRRIALILSVSPIKDAAGQVIGVSKIARDVTDRKKAEREVQRLGFERDRLLRRMQLQIERLPLAYILLDAEFRVIDWNPAAERIFGYRRDEALGMRPPFEKLVPPSSRLCIEALLRRFQSGDMSANSVNENLTKDGRTIICEWFNTPLQAERGGFDGVLCVGRDITAQRLAEQANLENQERFDLAVRGCNDGLGDWNLETGEGYWSPRVFEMLGCTKEEFGHNFNSISSRMHPDDRDRTLDELSERTRLHERVKSEFRLLTKSGEYLWIQGRGQAVYDDSGKATRFVGALTDISERKQMEANLALRDEQLRQSHKLEAVGSLAGGIAHEFNNLLQVIRGYGQYAMQGLPPEEQRYQDLEQVLYAADRAASLTRQLLGFSRLQVLERASFDHQEVVTDLVKLLRPLIGEHIELDVDLTTDVRQIHADRGLVQQMLLNLCINARDSMPAGGRLSLKTECVQLSERYCQFHPESTPGSYVVFSISDTGCGMPAEVRERIFEPFFTTKGVGKGTGLGLAMVYGSVQQHGGVINVYSEVGLGTTFKIYLPISGGGDSEIRQEQSLPASGGTETILIAEDESMVRELAVRILQGAGYSVLVATDGVEAVKLFEANAGTISLVLLDAIMPKMTGHEAYDRIQLVDPDMPAIFCSGYDPETGQIKSLMEQGCRLVQKPYDPDLLLKVVREVLDQSRLLQAPPCTV